jgi:hypothetical protein
VFRREEDEKKSQSRTSETAPPDELLYMPRQPKAAAVEVRVTARR